MKTHKTITMPMTSMEHPNNADLVELKKSIDHQIEMIDATRVHKNACNDHVKRHVDLLLVKARLAAEDASEDLADCYRILADRELAKQATKDVVTNLEIAIAERNVANMSAVLEAEMSQRGITKS